MRIFLSVFLLIVSFDLSAQTLSKGKERLQDAMMIQGQLGKGKVSLSEVRDEWRKATKDPIVKKDRDALAIAYASLAIVERNLDNLQTADSLFELSMPLFELQASKAYFLLAHANLQRDMNLGKQALASFTEIATDFDNLPQLKQIKFYAASGYAERAYAIDAVRNICLIGMRNTTLTASALATLQSVVKEHPSDELGLVALVASVKLDSKNAAKHEKKIESLIAKRATFADLRDSFSKELQ